MARRSARGLFLTFEGIDGCGKSTQLNLLSDYLGRLDLPYLVTREPGGTELGEQIRKILLRRSSAGMDARNEVLLYFASRAQNVAQVIRPALADGRIVLCDRFTDSSLAFQGYGRGLDPRFIRRLHDFACGEINPDLTFVVDISPETSVARARRRNVSARQDEGRFEEEALSFHRRVRRGYRALARQEPRRVKLIPGEQSIEAIHQRIVALARPLLARMRREGRQ
ncbi:MAG TPA: dTMP kinase [Candidatus Acidoferrales bacterium]|nr:dTMP kinase [Candidatus Acidoferrales bacterium]